MKIREWIGEAMTDANGEADVFTFSAAFALLMIHIIAVHDAFFVVPHTAFNYLGYGSAVGGILAGLGAKIKLEVKSASTTTSATQISSAVRDLPHA